MTKEYLVKDLWMAASLSLQLQIRPSLRNENGLVLFVFPSSDNLIKAVADYFAGTTLSSIGYSNEIKRLRSEMYAVRAQIGGEK